MALTIAVTRRSTSGDQHVVTGTIAFDSSYPTGGESFTPANIGLRVVDLMLFEQTKGFTYEYDYTNSKVKAYAQGALVGAAGAVTMDDFPVTAGPGVTASTSLSLASGSATVTWGGLKEVPNTNDMSTVTGVRFVAYGV
jgi:hypothetical protein